MRVLLVEDNDDDALLIRESLSVTTLEIVRAERLSTALAQLPSGKFDAVLLDLSLPDGWDWTRSAVWDGKPRLCRSWF